MFPSEVFIRQQKCCQLKILANIISNTKSLFHISTEKEGVQYFTKQFRGEKIAYLSKSTQSKQSYYTKL